MLGLNFYKGPRLHRNGRLDLDPYPKPTCIRTCLAASSMHRPSAHRRWPWSQATRFGRLCKSTEGYDAAVNKFTYALRAGGADEETTNSILQCTAPRRSWKVQQPSNITWLVLPFRFVWSRASIVQKNARCNKAWGSFTVRISWRMGK